MSTRLLALLAVIAAFGVLSAIALLDVGYFGIIRPHFETFGAGQVFADLVIACALACIWMVSDARERKLSAWPFVGITLVAGSFGPLLYLLLRELKSGARA